MRKIIVLALVLVISSHAAYAAKASASKKAAATSPLEVSGVDNRIKTLVYSDSEVYQVVARTGFQSQIEFGSNESIETISIGDPIGWLITPAGNRVFIKPLHKTGITNLSIITNKKSYQFELVSTDSSSRSSNHAYLIRFYYPETVGNPLTDPLDRTRNALRPISDTAIPLLPGAQPVAPPKFIGLPSAPPVAAPTQSLDLFNFNYTLTGPVEISPKKIYDDGKITYFEFAKNVESPEISVINPDGDETDLNPIVKDGPYNKIVSVNRVAGKFSIRSGDNVVQVFNEQILSLAPLNPATSGKN